MKNQKVNKAIQVATIAGASLLVVNSAMSLVKVKSVKEAIMPSVSILVGLAAFNYALNQSPLVVVRSTK